jgi:sulfur-oxidizing protein SoxX
MMRKFALSAVACVFAAGLAQAETIPPGKVVFGDGGAVSESLTGVPGDAARGEKVFVTKSEGNCVACHQVPILSKVQFQGNIGPVLEDVGNTYTTAQLRGIVTDAKHTFDGSMMPSFYKVSGFIRPGDGFTGKAAKEINPLLTAQQVEDVVAFLQTLKH